MDRSVVDVETARQTTMVAGVVKDKKVVETEVLDLQMMLKQRSIVGSAIDNSKL